jgi:hypothetical protein
MNFVRMSRNRILTLRTSDLWPVRPPGEMLLDRRVISWIAIVAACLLAVVAGRQVAARPIFVVGGMAGAILLFWLAVRPRVAVMSVIVYTPFEEFLLKFVPAQAYALARYLPELLLIMTLALIVVASIVSRSEIRRTPLDVPVACFLGISLVSIFYNRIPVVVGVLELRILLRYAVLSYVVMLAGFDRQFVRKAFELMLVVLAIQVALGLMHSLGGDAVSSLLSPRNVTIGDIFVRRGFSQIVSSHTRIFSTFGRYNLYGNYLAFFLLFVISFLYVREREIDPGKKRRLRLLLLAGLAALLLSFSRMSWVGFYAGLVFMLMLTRRKRVIAYLIIPVTVTIILFRLYGSGAREVSETATATVMQRYLGMFSRRYMEASLRGDRLYALTTTTRRVLQISPVLGLGPGSVASAAARVFGGGERWEVLDLPSDNVIALGDVGWAAILAQYGLLGLAGFAWLLVRILRASLECFRRARDSLDKVIALGFAGGFACVMVENLFSFNFTYRPSSLYFWVFAGLVVRLLHIQREERAKSEQ